jgi:hypothetical protein
MSKHHWVKIQITPVHVVSDSSISDEPVVYSSDDDEIEAAASVQYGCLKCDEPLTSDTVDADCEVPSIEKIDLANKEE